MYSSVYLLKGEFYENKEKFDTKIKDTNNYICLDRW